MIIVTGGAGFIGSNLVKRLNQLGVDEILVVDHLQNGEKIVNLSDCKFIDYLDKSTFLEKIKARKEFSNNVQAIFHQGACSNTAETDGRYLLENNFEYSKQLLLYCLHYEIPFIYASSAAVYGTGSIFKEQVEYERPINGYAFSKFVFDQYVRHTLAHTKAPIMGLRYFNVYGPREQHKGPMASVVFHFSRQVCQEGALRLFEGSGGYENGEQRRDFIDVEDVVDVNLWFLEHLDKRGIFNVGTGQGTSFNQVAKAIQKWHQKGTIQYIPFPEHLKGHYQHFTQADITPLRQAGYDKPFTPIEEGVRRYLEWLYQNAE